MKMLAHAAVVAAGVSACTAQQAAQQQQVVRVLCMHDAILQPVAVVIAASTGPQGAAAAQTDALLVHPAVVAACAAYGAKPLVATPVADPAAAVAPVAVP